MTHIAYTYTWSPILLPIYLNEISDPLYTMWCSHKGPFKYLISPTWSSNRDGPNFEEKILYAPPKSGLQPIYWYMGSRISPNMRWLKHTYFYTQKSHCRNTYWYPNTMCFSVHISPFFPLYQYQLSRVSATKLIDYNWYIIKVMSIVVLYENNISLITNFLL